MNTDLPLARLREVREARGLSLDELAERLNTSRQVISRYETGKAIPRMETFVRLCAALDVTPALFQLPGPIPEPAPLFFRHFRSRTTQKHLNAVKRQVLWFRDIVSALEELLILPRVAVPDFSPPSDPRQITIEQVEEAATALRREWGFGDGIIIEMAKLVESKGCIIACGLVDSATIDAFSLWTKAGRPLIALNAAEGSPSRTRFDIAHELGHLILHRKIDRRFVELNPSTHKIIEQQAHRFAGAFLMPEVTFRKSIPYVSLDALLLVKPQWNLSVATMLHRAQDLKMVDPAITQNLWINLTRRGWKREEPLEDVVAIEEPRLLINALGELGDSGITALSKRVGLSTSDYERFAGLPDSTLNLSAIGEYNVTKRSENRSKLA